MGKLSESITEVQVAELENWKLEADRIVREVELPDFPAAIAFVTRVAFLAEQDDHHPEIAINWRKVTLTLTTHDADGLTEKDFKLAKRIEKLMG